MINTAKKKSPYNVNYDRDLLQQALDKAQEKNIALSAGGLINFMLIKVIRENLNLDLDPRNFNWKESSKKTTVNLLTEEVLQMCPLLQVQGLRYDYSFMCNLLLYNFLNNF